MSDLINRREALQAIWKVTSEVGQEIENGKMNVPPTGVITGMGIAASILVDLPSAEPNIETLTPEEIAVEISPVSLCSGYEWYKVAVQLYQMGYVICRREDE